MTHNITIIGLGPGDPNQLTLEALEALEDVPEIYLRTLHHPTAQVLAQSVSGTIHSFDHLYEKHERFYDVYAAITAQVIELAHRAAGVLYAVPGHPLVGETTVHQILARATEEGLTTRIIAGLSFLEPVLTTLRLEPLDGLQITEAMLLAQQHCPLLDPDRPALIAQLYSRVLASDVKLALMNVYPDEHPVTVIQSAGTPNEVARTVPLYQLDWADSLPDLAVAEEEKLAPSPAHLTSLYVPPLPRPGSPISFQELIAHLRAPDGCPWDRKQTHKSLRQHLLEETYEVLDALDRDDADKLCEELGDLLLQIFLHTQIAVDTGEFRLSDVIDRITTKLIRRHPHVFGSTAVSGTEEVLNNWEQIKQREREENGAAQRGENMLNGIPKSLPALEKAQEIQNRVARIGFDWEDAAGVIDKLEEEIAELREAEDAEHLSQEFGDLLFSLVNLARWWRIDAESTLREANMRFVERFTYMEKLAQQRGLQLTDLNIARLDELWEEAKLTHS